MGKSKDKRPPRYVSRESWLVVNQIIDEVLTEEQEQRDREQAECMRGNHDLWSGISGKWCIRCNKGL